MKLKILIVDNEDLLRNGLKAMLKNKGQDWEVLDACDGISAVRIAKSESPDIVLMDYLMPGIDGIEAAKMIRRLNPKIRIIMVSGINTDKLKIKTIKAGLHGFFPKTNHENELYQAINDVMNGKVYFKGDVGDFVIDHLLNDHLLGNSGTVAGFRFTAKELQYLRLVAEGDTNQAISVAMGISPRTVEKHKSNIFAKTGIHSSRELVVFMYKNQVLYDKGINNGL